jgi:hypothetical protein
MQLTLKSVAALPRRFLAGLSNRGQLFVFLACRMKQQTASRERHWPRCKAGPDGITPLAVLLI